MLATVDFSNNLTWAVFIAWVMSVVMHEFGHGIVAYFGGDYTIRERGGLTLNPLQYIDPVFSLIIPAIIFLVGGVPLPGGVTYVRRDLISSRLWQSMVSLAGPAMNFVIFLACAVPLHPKIGWIKAEPVDGQWSVLVLFLGAFAWLQLLAVFFNLMPVPSLDGFGVIEPFLDAKTRESLSVPQLRRGIFFLWFIVIWQVPAVMGWFDSMIVKTMMHLGFGRHVVLFSFNALVSALYGEPMP